MSVEAKIRALVKDILPDSQYFITDVIVKQSGRKSKVTVYVDGDQGIDIGVCSSISRQLGSQLEQSSLLNGSYILEVSSPGLDQPLRMGRQYPKNIGRDIRVHLEEGVVEGKLAEVQHDFIIINQNDGSKEQSRKIKFSDIIKTHVLVSF